MRREFYCRPGASATAGQRKGGLQTAIWVRETTFLRRAEGVWSITHEHVSLPFHLEILQPWLPAGKDDRPVLTAGGGA